MSALSKPKIMCMVTRPCQLCSLFLPIMLYFLSTSTFYAQIMSYCDQLMVVKVTKFCSIVELVVVL